MILDSLVEDRICSLTLRVSQKTRCSNCEISDSIIRWRMAEKRAHFNLMRYSSMLLVYVPGAHYNDYK
jgi:hypothetical protein